VSDPQPYDPRRSLSAHRAQERSAWDRYAASALAAFMEQDIDPRASGWDHSFCAHHAAQWADAMLAERRRRFPGPKIRVEEET
jgi:hypothetical protein